MVCGSKEEDGYRGANPRISSPGLGLAAQRPLSARGKKRQITSADGVGISWEKLGGDRGMIGRVGESLQEAMNPTPLRMDDLARLAPTEFCVGGREREQLPRP